jgi:hypothetical protein
LSKPLFLPFQFKTVNDQIALFALLHQMRLEAYPMPHGAGKMLLLLDDNDLRAYAKGIERHARRAPRAERLRAAMALDTLAYFHGLRCKSPGACLGEEIDKTIEKFTA